MKSEIYDSKFWWLNFELNRKDTVNNDEGSSRCIFLENEMENTNKGSSELLATGQVTDHDYNRSRLSENENSGKMTDHNYCKKEITYEELEDENILEEYLKCVSEMEAHDLNKLNKERVEVTKENIGLLWHYKLGHVSKTYLERFSKYIPELENV